MGMAFLMPAWWKESASRMDSVRMTSEESRAALEVQHTTEWARKIAVAVGLHSPSVEIRPLAGLGVRNRNDDAAAQQLSSFGGDHAQGKELVTDGSFLGNQLQKRTVRIADLKRS